MSKKVINVNVRNLGDLTALIITDDIRISFQRFTPEQLMVIPEEFKKEGLYQLIINQPNSPPVKHSKLRFPITPSKTYRFKTLTEALKSSELLSEVLDYPNQPHEFELPPEAKEILFNEGLDEELSSG